MKISENIFLFEGFGLDSNCYLVLGDENFLVDTGDGSRKERLLDFLNKKLDSEKLDIILNTHFHSDHVGGNKFIREKTGAKFLAYKSFKNPEVGADSFIKEGESIGDFEVLHTPGHSPGAICLYSEEKKVLMSGDTIFGSGSVGRTDLERGNASKLQESVKQLDKLDVEVLLPGHGKPALEKGNKIIATACSNFKT